jgi:ABC-type nickel/cobalt efflux system permease component RcnA
MKDTTAEVLTAGAWGLHLSSFIMQSMPYLQAISLILAITVSLVTLRKLIKDERRKRRG